MFGGNRTGKTVAGAVEAVWRARGIHPFKENKPCSGWVVSVSNETQRDVAQKEILKWLHPTWILDVKVRSGSKDDPENAIIDFIVVENVLGSTSIIGFKSCEQGRIKFQGTSKDWIWFDEEPPKEIYDECKMRVVDTQGDIWGTMTPLMGLTWVYQTIYLNERQDSEVQSWVMQWSDNPWLSAKEIAALESTMTEDEREARQYGRFVALSGLIYKEFREDIHVIDPFAIPKGWFDNISIDPGYTNPLSAHFYACDGDGTIYVIAEHYQAQMRVKEHSERLKAIARALSWPRNSLGGLNALIDSAANQKTIAAEKSATDLFIENGISCNSQVDKDVWTGIQRVKNYLKLQPHEDTKAWPKGKPRIFIFRNCPHMIREFKSYRWAEPKEGVNAKEEPKKSNDHGMDELRYYIMSKPETYVDPTKYDGFYTPGELEDLGVKTMEIVRLKDRSQVL